MHRAIKLPRCIKWPCVGRGSRRRAGLREFLEIGRRASLPDGGVSSLLTFQRVCEFSRRNSMKACRGAGTCRQPR